MSPLLYDDLVSWYGLLDPVEDHRDEAECYGRAFDSVLGGSGSSSGATLLELGAGAGHNAFHVKDRFRCTLTDVSEPMLARSRTLNPECEHLLGDMRTLRLDRTFDAVLVHDAVMYMLTEDDLRAAVQTALLHTRPGGAALFAPDCTRETFTESSQLHTGADGTRALRCLEWAWNPVAADGTYVVDYAFMLRDGLDVRVVHDRHVEGLFTRATWVDVLSSAGFAVEMVARPLGDGETDEVFLCQRGLAAR